MIKGCLKSIETFKTDGDSYIAHGREMADSLTKFADGIRAVPDQSDPVELYAADTLMELVEFQTRYFDAFRDMHMQLTSGIINYVTGIIDASRATRGDLKGIERSKQNLDGLQKKYDKEIGVSSPRGDKVLSLKDQIDGTKNEIFVTSSKSYQDIAQVNKNCVNFGGLFFTAFYSGLSSMVDECHELLEDAQALNSEFLRKTGQVSGGPTDDDVNDDDDVNGSGDVTHDERDGVLLEMIEEEKKNMGRLESILKYKTRISEDMREKDRGLSNEEFDVIFLNIYEMINLHKDVLAGLESMKSIPGKELTLATNSLYGGSTIERFRKAYRLFVERSGIAQWTLERARGHKTFGSYFARLAQQTVVFGIYPLDQLLGMPARHIKKVAHVLHKMLAATPAVDEGWLELWELCERYDAITAEVTLSKEDGDNAKELTALQDKLVDCDSEVAEVGRVHVHSDTFTMVEYTPSNSVIRPPTSLVPQYFVSGQTLYAFLFNDSIIFAVRKSNALVSLAHETFLYLTKYSLEDLVLTQLSDASSSSTGGGSSTSSSGDSKYCITMTFTTSGESLVLACKTKEQLDTWTEKISGCLSAWHKSQVFGVMPDEIMARVPEQGNFVPTFLADSVRFVELHGLTSEGIFRISGSKKTVDTLKFQVNVGRRVAYPDAFTAAVMLKQWLQSLPEPLMGEGMVDAWVSAAREEDEAKRVSAFQDVLSKLSEANRHVVYAVIGIARKAADNAKETKMSPKNLAIVLSPSMLWSKTDQSMIAKTSDSRLNVIKVLIEGFHEIFAGVAEEEKRVTMEKEREEIEARNARKLEVERLRKEQMEAQEYSKRDVVSAEEYARKKEMEREREEREREQREREEKHKKKEKELKKKLERMKEQMEAEKKKHEEEEAERIKLEELKKK